MSAPTPPPAPAPAPDATAPPAAPPAAPNAGTGGRAGRPLWVLVAAALVGSATLPPLGIATLLSARNADQRRTAAETRARNSARAVCFAADAYVDQYRTALRMLAAEPALLRATANFAGRPGERAGGPVTDDDRLVHARLRRTHELFPGFRSLLVADAAGDVRVAHLAGADDAPGTATARARAASNVSDRPYFAEAMRGRGPFVSDAFRGRSLGADPLVALSVPVMPDAAGAPLGIVQGALDLSRMRELDRGFAGFQQTEFAVVDRNGLVIHASPGMRLAPLDDARGHPLAAAFEAYRPERPVWLRATAQETAAPSDRVSATHLAVVCEMRTGWRGLLALSTTSLNAEIAAQRRVASVWALGAACLAAAVAAAVARLVTRPLERLVRAVEGAHVAGRDAAVAAALAAPADGPREVRALAGALADLLHRVRASQQALRAEVDGRERVIAERTEALREANAALVRMAATDPLTGLANRRAFDERVAALAAEAPWRGEPCALLVFDVDHFKKFNDRYGHPAGDACLARVGHAVAAQLRQPSDVAARIGGEEFALLLPGAGGPEGRAVAERLRAAVEGLAIPHADSAHGVVTLSVGVAAWPLSGADAPAPGEPFDAAALLALADAALYDAKHGGRNCVRAAALVADPGAPAETPDGPARLARAGTG